MKKFKKIVSLALASVMALGMFTTTNLTTTALADNEAGSSNTVTSTTVSYDSIEVTKKVTVDKKGTLLPTETFTITMVPASSDEMDTNHYLVETSGDNTVYITDSNGNKIYGNGPELTSDSLEFTFNSTDSTALGYVEKTDKFDISSLGFSNTGVFRYYVTEVQPEEENGYITYDDSKYIVDLYVDKDSDGKYYVKNYIITKVGDTTKPPKIEFDNEISCSTLKIYKIVDGTEYTADEIFEFRILIPEGGTTIHLEEGQTFNAKIYNSTGPVTDVDNGRTDADGNVTITVKGNDISADMETNASTFYLKNGEWLQIDGVPVTMIYKVEEVTDKIIGEGYTVTYDYDEYGTNTNNKESNKENDAVYDVYNTSTGSLTDQTFTDQTNCAVYGTINTTTNEVTFKNTRIINSPNSGVSIDFLPYALVMVIAICGSVLFLLAKKRKH